MKRILLSTLLAAAATVPSFGAKPNVPELKDSITDNAIVYPETYEKNTRKLLDGWYLKNYTATDNHYTQPDVPVSDETIKRRLAAMPTIIEMPYNQIVRNYIKRYTEDGREQVAAILGLSLYYTPIFEQALEKAGLPLELKYLPVIESGLDPNAVSRSGAAGLWQLMLVTARGLDLRINSLVDERRDPYRSTEKAVAYLKDLHETFGDWSLAIAAYNCGANAIHKALSRAGGDPKKHDFWSIYKYLSPQTRGYVPMFIAANYVMTYHKEHNISPVLATKPLITDTVAVHDRLHFKQISDMLSIPIDELRTLNPQYRADIIPASPDSMYFLTLPSQQIQAYLVSEKEIFAHDAELYRPRVTVEPGDVAVAVPYEPAISSEKAENTPEQKPAYSGKQNTIHKVAAGETLASIAKQYDVEPDDIKKWNNLRRGAVRAGQQLKIYPSPELTAEESQPKNAKAAKQTKEAPDAAKASAKTSDRQGKQQAKTSKTKKSDKQSKHKKQKTKKTPKHTPKTTSVEVRSGDNLSKIAKRNGVSVEELRKANPNLKGDMLHPGDKLKVPSKQKAGKKKSKKGKKRR